MAKSSRPARWKDPRWLILVGGVAALLGNLAFVALRVLGPSERVFQSDLYVYAAAAQLLAEGANPYEFAALRSLGATNPFVYTPLTLPLVELLSWVPYPTLYASFFLLKLVAFLALVALWSGHFRDSRAWLGVLLLLTLVGFRLTVRVDFFAGNISVFEQLAVWLAIAALLRGRLAVFCAVLCGAALFKVTPLAYLALVFVAAPPRRAIATVAAGLLGCAAVAGLSWGMDPEPWSEFTRAAAAIDERGSEGNVSTLALLRDLLPHHSAAAGLTFGVWAGALVALSARAVKRIDDAFERVCLALLCAALCLPRFKDYTFILLLPAATVGLRRALSHSWVHFIVIAATLSVPLHDYQRWAAALLLWVTLATRGRPASRVAEPVTGAAPAAGP